MQFKYKSKISITTMFINLVIITSFFYWIFYAYNFKKYSTPTIVKAYETNLNILQKETSDGSQINVNNIIIPNNNDWLIYYIVQPWDSISEIASNFWVTVSHIKKVNKLKNDFIRPWEKLTITDQAGFIYISKWETLKELSKKFKISENDILESNSITINDEWFSKWDEIFIPLSDTEYKKLFPTKTHKKYISPVVNYTYHGKNIIKKYWYRPNIYNWFYKWQCTRFVAIKKFPYINKYKQKKLWNWNARYWYQNAKKAWYNVWKIPKVDSIVVIKIWWSRYYYAWHVAIVKKIDYKHKRLLIEEMNALWKYIVTYRWIPINREIKWYIYI